ncbi:hypothetical protein [Streptomyces sp. Isolate_45]|uniref:hypothetical protein n=1 Tax=Streptomyces sp. Isolate_45 TaxID=2950111 RepID=UPI002482034E|nr:hypothetical protein [Streptomyces sp. Isolate_45]MDA5284746.1 hypothetical protein [Streptomyces sp. Isolate_45]
MSTSDQGGESTGAESGREPERRRPEPAPARPRPTARRLAGRVARAVVGDVVEVVVNAWAPEWAEVARVLVVAVPAVLALRRGRCRRGGGRPRG